MFVLVFTGISFLMGCGNDDSSPLSTVTELEAAAGDIITIEGTFDPNETYIVEFGGVEGSIIEIQPTFIRVEVPSNAESGDIVLIHNGEETVVGTIEITTTTAELTIYDANSWVDSTTPLTTVQDAEIKLFRDEDSFNSGNADFIALTNVNGIATFALPKPGEDADGDGKDDESGISFESFYDFIILIEKGNKANTKDGYNISGAFLCQSELDNLNATAQEAYQTDYQQGASVGSIRYTDANGDGIIDESDQSSYGWVSLKTNSSNDGPTPVDDEGSESSCDIEPTEKNVGYIGS